MNIPVPWSMWVCEIICHLSAFGKTTGNHRIKRRLKIPVPKWWKAARNYKHFVYVNIYTLSAEVLVVLVGDFAVATLQLVRSGLMFDIFDYDIRIPRNLLNPAESLRESGRLLRSWFVQAALWRAKLWQGIASRQMEGWYSCDGDAYVLYCCV